MKTLLFRKRYECSCKQPLINGTTLPCDHEICGQCWLDILNRQRICPTCRQSFSQDWEYEARSQNNPKEQAFLVFRKRCNAFMMAVVSRLVFGGPGQQTPADDLIHHLMGYVFASAQPNADGVAAARTQEFGFLRAGLLDPSPVFRSFLLQQLLRATDAKTAANHLTLWLDRSRELLPEHHDQVNLAVVVVQCFEDVALSQRAAALEKNIDRRCEEALNFMERLENQLKKSDVDSQGANMLQELSNFELLESVACIRVGLTLVADVFKDFLMQPSKPNFFKEVLHMCEDICDRFQWPRYYFIRQLYRRHGTELMWNVLRYTQLASLFSTELFRQHKENIFDVFVIYGEPYRTIYRALTKKMSGDEISLRRVYRQQLIEGSAAPHTVGLALLMYLYQVRYSYLNNALDLRKWYHVKDKAVVLLNETEHSKGTATAFASSLQSAGRARNVL